MNSVFAILVTFALVLINGFFVGAEFALISARRDRLEALAEAGKHRARTVLRASENLPRMLAGAQLGVTGASIVLGLIGEPTVAHLIEAPMHALGAPDSVVSAVGFTLALAIVAFLHTVLGEMVPKNIALAGPEQAAMLLVPAHVAFSRIARPPIAFYNWLTRLSLRAFGIAPRDELETAVSRVELTEMVGVSRSEGLLDEDEHLRLLRALRTADRTVADSLIPLGKVRSLRADRRGVALSDIEDVVLETGYSRYPVESANGTLLGYIHIKDMLDRIANGNGELGDQAFAPHSTIRPLATVPIHTPLPEAVDILRARGGHLAKVVDEGKTVGVVALEDLVEEFVGTVRDATHRRSEPPRPND